MKTTNKKFILVISYCVGLVCLILGFVLPVYDGKNMLIMMLPNAMYKAFGLSFLENIGKEFTRSYPLYFFGKVPNGIDAISIAVSLYAIITVVGIIMLIPVFASKASSNIPAKCAAFVECVAALILTAYTIMEIVLYIAEGSGFKWDLGLVVIALGGIILMIILQSLINFKHSSIAKILLFIMGAVSAICLLPVINLFSLKTTSLFSGKLAINLTANTDGITTLTYFINFGLSGTVKEKLLLVFISLTSLLVIINLVLDIFAMATKTKKYTILTDILRYALQSILAIVTIVLLFVFKKELLLEPGLLIYVIVIVSFLQLIITFFRIYLFNSSAKENKVEDVGQTEQSSEISQSSDAVTVAEPAVQPAPEPVVQSVAEPVVQPAPEPVVQPAPEPAVQSVAEPVVQPAPEPAVQPVAEPVVQPVYQKVVQPVYQPAPQPVYQPVYTEQYAAPKQSSSQQYIASGSAEKSVKKPVYNGPVDKFISKLNDHEKIEFYNLFIAQNRPVFSHSLKYTVYGNNKEFFSALFIYLGKYRSIISDELMKKIYLEYNLYK